MRRLVVDVSAQEYATVRLPVGGPAPVALLESAGVGLVSITRTPDEVSVICPVELAPDGERTAGWRLLSVRGPLEFSLTGIMASVAGALAAAGVSLFALSTVHTDHLLVRGENLDRAVSALAEAGHQVNVG